jgi:hypothetical protein
MSPKDERIGFRVSGQFETALLRVAEREGPKHSPGL